MSELKGPLVPISEEQLAANRANAAKSTGPRTPEGKARSARNSRAHGFTASTFARESGLFTACLDTALDGQGNSFISMSPGLAGNLSLDIEITRAQNRNYALADGFQRMVRQANGWSLFLRYHAQAERHYRESRFTKRSHFGAQPEETETTCPPPDEPISGSQPAPEPRGRNFN